MAARKVQACSCAPRAGILVLGSPVPFLLGTSTSKTKKTKESKTTAAKVVRNTEASKKKQKKQNLERNGGQESSILQLRPSRGNFGFGLSCGFPDRNLVGANRGTTQRSQGESREPPVQS